MKKWIKTAMLVLVTALVAGGVSNWLTRSAQTKVYITVEGVRELSYLTTTEYSVSDWVEKTYRSDLVFKDVDSDHVIAVVKGKIKGSVDLENATIDIQRTADSKVDRDSVSIFFPRGSIKISKVEVEDSRVFSCRGITITNLVTKGASDNQKNRLRREAREHLIKGAIDTDIVERTRDNAKTALSGFLGSLGYDVIIKWDENAYDPSYNPSAAAS